MAGMVTVGCKVPNGLIIRAFHFVERSEQVMGGGSRLVKTAIDTGVRVNINGTSAPHGKAKLDEHGDPIIMVGGFALTSNVDADVWACWIEQNAESDIVKNGLIFAHSKQMDARAEAREKARVRTGLEPMSPDSDPRMPKQRQRLRGGAVGALETANAGS